ncbi:MAG: SRPBCC domain-containing protein [Candidatus Brocadiae bacterium]|nr:SRPBCC domain-containing protein [Candidatus Brocadiia bacterium]
MKTAVTLKEARGPVAFTTESWIAAPAARVWQLLTKGPWLSRWFTSATSGDLDAPGTVRLWWGKSHEDVQVVKARWEKSFEFLWVAYGVKDATRVTVSLRSKNGMTRVRISERGWKRDRAGTESALHHAEGWAVCLCQLKAFAQFGIELRG